MAGRVSSPMAIRAAIAHALARKAFSAPNNTHNNNGIHSPSSLDILMADPDTRGMCYTAAISIADEEQPKRGTVGKLLTEYIVGFPPEESIIMKIISMCSKYSKGASEYSQEEEDGGGRSVKEIFRELNTLAQAHIAMAPLQLNSYRQTPVQATDITLTGRTSPGLSYQPAPTYTHLQSFQPLVKENSSRQSTPSRSKRLIDFPSISDSDRAVVVYEKNVTILKQQAIQSNIKKSEKKENSQQSSLNKTINNLDGISTGGRLMTNICSLLPTIQYPPTPNCKEYIDQSPLGVTKDILLQQIRVLSAYHDSYAKNNIVAQATSVVIKLMCDGYVSKIPLKSCGIITEYEGGLFNDEFPSAYPFLREISIAFVPTVFLKLLDSEYSCCRAHAYEMLLKLAIHLQLMDRSGTFLEFQSNDNATPSTSSLLVQALEAEISWIFARIVEKQARITGGGSSGSGGPIDERLWNIALKCCLICVPPQNLRFLDAKALKLWMLLPNISVSFPHVYSVLAEALALKLLIRPESQGIIIPLAATGEVLGPNSLTNTLHIHQHHQVTSVGTTSSNKENGTGTSPRDASVVNAIVDKLSLYSSLCISEESLDEHLGVHGQLEVVQLYSLARSVIARTYLFCVIFAISAAKQGIINSAIMQELKRPVQEERDDNGSVTGSRFIASQSSHQQEASSERQDYKKKISSCSQLPRCLRLLTDVSLHWHLHVLVNYTCHTIPKDLPQQLWLDIDVNENRDIKSHLIGIIGIMLVVISAHRKLPDMLIEMISSTADDFVALNQLGKECCGVISDMVKHDTDCSLTRIASQIVYHLLRILRSPRHQSRIGEDDASQQLMTTITSHPTLGVRLLGSEVLGSMAALCRTNINQGATYSELLRLSLQKEKNITQLMTIYYIIVESLVVQCAGALHFEGDVSSLIAGMMASHEGSAEGRLHILRSAAELHAPQTFWQLYWGLHHTQIFAAQRARLVLVTILSALQQRGGAACQIVLWTKVMADPYPPVAMVGAQSVVRIAAVSEHEIYEAAVDSVVQCRDLSGSQPRNGREDGSNNKSDDEDASCLWKHSGNENVEGMPSGVSVDDTNSYTLATIIWSRMETEIRRRSE